MDKIKILYTIPNFETAGSGKVVHDLVKGLDKEKFSPEILKNKWDLIVIAVSSAGIDLIKENLKQLKLM